MFMKFKKLSLLITSIIFVLILLYSFNLLINEKIYNIGINNNIKLEIKKIILVGDSRMDLMYKSKKELLIPNSILFTAKSGVKIDWLYEKGISKLYNIFSNKNYKYYVVFNLGVNDLHYVEDVELRVQEYYKLYNNIVKNNPNIEFYFLSVNPIIEDVLKENFGYDEKKTNKKINRFNKKMKSLIDNSNSNNFKYCDSNNSLDFVIPDGIHFDLNTNKSILDFIINRCIKINKNYYYKKHTIYW